MSEIKLKPCPFCGARSSIGNGPRLTDFESLHRRIYEVHCEQCTATINRWFDSEEEAAEAWNKRAEPLGRWINENADTIECSNCHHVFDDSILLNADEKTFWNYPKYCPNCGAKMDGGGEQ